MTALCRSKDDINKNISFFHFLSVSFLKLNFGHAFKCQDIHKRLNLPSYLLNKYITKSFGAVKNAKHRFFRFDRPEMSYYVSQQLPHIRECNQGIVFKANSCSFFFFLHESFALLSSSVCIAGEPLVQVADTRTISLCLVNVPASCVVLAIVCVCVCLQICLCTYRLMHTGNCA